MPNIKPSYSKTAILFLLACQSSHQSGALYAKDMDNQGGGGSQKSELQEKIERAKDYVKDKVEQTAVKQGIKGAIGAAVGTAVGTAGGVAIGVGVGVAWPKDTAPGWHDTVPPGTPPHTFEAIAPPDAQFRTYGNPPPINSIPYLPYTWPSPNYFGPGYMPPSYAPPFYFAYPNPYFQGYEKRIPGTKVIKKKVTQPVWTSILYDFEGGLRAVLEAANTEFGMIKHGSTSVERWTTSAISLDDFPRPYIVNEIEDGQHKSFRGPNTLEKDTTTFMDAIEEPARPYFWARFNPYRFKAKERQGDKLQSLLDRNFQLLERKISTIVPTSWTKRTAQPWIEKGQKLVVFSEGKEQRVVELYRYDKEIWLYVYAPMPEITTYNFEDGVEKLLESAKSHFASITESYKNPYHSGSSGRGKRGLLKIKGWEIQSAYGKPSDDSRGSGSAIYECRTSFSPTNRQSSFHDYCERLKKIIPKSWIIKEEGKINQLYVMEYEHETTKGFEFGTSIELALVDDQIILCIKTPSTVTFRN